MKRSRENASAVLTRHRSAEQEGYSMRPEWWMMHRFPDNATKGYRENKEACSTYSVSPSLWLHGEEPCTMQRWSWWAACAYGTRSKVCDAEEQWRTVIAPLQTLQHPVSGLTRSAHNRSGSHTKHTFRKLWPNCEKIHSSKNRKWLAAALNQRTPLNCNPEKNADTLQSVATMWYSRWSKKKRSRELKVSFDVICVRLIQAAHCLIAAQCSSSKKYSFLIKRFALAYTPALVRTLRSLWQRHLCNT